MHTVRTVRPLENYRLLLRFDTSEERIFDVSPYVHKGIFTELLEQSYFKQVHTFLGSITWPHGQDFDPDHLYLESIAVS